MRWRARRPITAYIGFDCTAPSLHVGSLLPIMLLYWLQQTGHRPIALMGGGTTRVGDPSGKDESRRLLTDEVDQRQSQRHPRDLRQVPEIRGRRRQRRSWPTMPIGSTRSTTSISCATSAATSRSTACSLRFGEAAARPPAGTVVSRIQLHDPAGLRFRRALPALRLRAADGRLRSVGQHRQRHRSRPPPAQRAILRADRAADHDVLGRQDGQDRGRRGLAQCRSW